MRIPVGFETVDCSKSPDRDYFLPTVTKERLSFYLVSFQKFYEKTLTVSGTQLKYIVFKGLEGLKELNLAWIINWYAIRICISSQCLLGNPESCKMLERSLASSFSFDPWWAQRQNTPRGVNEPLMLLFIWLTYLFGPFLIKEEQLYWSSSRLFLPLFLFGKDRW